MTNYSTSSLAKQYSQLNTVPAMVGIAFAAASSVQFLDATLTFGLLNYTFEANHAMVVSLVALIVAFAASDTKSFEHYSREEQGVVALGALLIVGNEYVTQISDFIVQNEPVAGVAAFGITVAAWGVLAR